MQVRHSSPTPLSLSSPSPEPSLPPALFPAHRPLTPSVRPLNSDQHTTQRDRTRHRIAPPITRVPTVCGMQPHLFIIIITLATKAPVHGNDVRAGTQLGALHACHDSSQYRHAAHAPQGHVRETAQAVERPGGEARDLVTSQRHGPGGEPHDGGKPKKTQHTAQPVGTTPRRGTRRRHRRRHAD